MRPDAWSFKCVLIMPEEGYNEKMLAPSLIEWEYENQCERLSKTFKVVAVWN